MMQPINIPGWAMLAIIFGGLTYAYTRGRARGVIAEQLRCGRLATAWIGKAKNIGEADVAHGIAKEILAAESEGHTDE